MSKIVRYKHNLDDLPELSTAQKAELEALAKRPDSEIDFSDIPELYESFWQNTVRNPYYKPVKKSTTVRIDADVMQHYLYNPTAPMMEHEKARFTQLANEFGLRFALKE